MCSESEPGHHLRPWVYDNRSGHVFWRSGCQNVSHAQQCSVQIREEMLCRRSVCAHRQRAPHRLGVVWGTRCLCAARYALASAQRLQQRSKHLPVAACFWPMNNLQQQPVCLWLEEEDCQQSGRGSTSAPPGRHPFCLIQRCQLFRQQGRQAFRSRSCSWCSVPCSPPVVHVMLGPSADSLVDSPPLQVFRQISQSSPG